MHALPARMPPQVRAKRINRQKRRICAKVAQKFPIASAPQSPQAGAVAAHRADGERERDDRA